jgi:hypothetical protein
MKNLLLVLALVTLLLACDNGNEPSIFDNTTIQNSSSYSVEFEFLNGNSRTFNISPLETVYCYSHGAKLRKFTFHNGRVSYKLVSDYSGEFYNTIPIAMNIRNTLDIPVTLSEKNNCMDIVSIIIDTKEIKDIGNIYTKTPMFITSPSVNTNYIINNEIMYVTIFN